MYPSLSKNDIVVEVIRRIKELDFKASSYAFAVSASEKNAFGNVKNSACLSKYSFFCFESYFIFTLISLQLFCFYFAKRRPLSSKKLLLFASMKAL